ncbi:MAG TPA: fibronectin type III domain-containing protein, partial [Paludibacteraceae bacterium]|nr:fibronectin type III domain-containing protein [Paludibacteraceae bacterium]
MRNIFCNFLAILLAFVFVGNLSAQTPEQLSYQAIVRNSNDQLVSNKTIGLKVTILKGSESGEVVYQEILSPTTNVNGLLNIKIGSQAGFSTIDWANGPYFIKTEVDIEGNGNYTITTVAQILSVPYAKHAETVNRLLTISNEECGTTNRGAIRYDEDNNNLVFCNGSNWVAVGSGNATNLTPALTTLPAIHASKASARLMASSVDKNAIVVLKKGFVWATTPMPTLYNNVIDVNANFDEFSAVVTNLQPNTTYYVRSFAVNHNGVGYGNEVSFTTAGQPKIIAPPAGKVTLAICVPEGTCNGAVLTGSPFGWDPASGTAAFTKVAGTETWY